MYYVIHLQQRLAQRGLIKKAFEENTAVIADTAAHGTLFTCFTGTKVQILTQVERVLQVIGRQWQTLAEIPNLLLMQYLIYYYYASGDWEAVTDADGDTYYWNKKSNETTWEKPPGFGGVCVCVCVCVLLCFVCVCVCVWERERERERGLCLWVCVQK